MAKIKTIEVFITLLKITSEDKWLADYIKRKGNSIYNSPQYKYLQGYPEDMLRWMRSRGINADYVSHKMMHVLKDLIERGQEEPIKIYKDMRINNGHKRAACMAFLGYKKIKAEIVENNYKL